MRLQGQEKEIKTARDALALLCRLSYKKFGKDALILIEEVCYKLGVADSRKIGGNLSGRDFKTINEMFLGDFKKRGFPIEIIELSQRKRHSKFYGQCPLGLENTSLDLCKASMALDKGLFEAAIGKRVGVDIIKSKAAGDSYCETLWSLIE